MKSKKLKTYLKRAVFESYQSKALNKHIGACLVPATGEVPIGAYNGPPRGIPERHNWDRFPPEIRDKLWEEANKKHKSYDDKMLPKNLRVFCRCHPDVDYDPRYLLGYKSGQGLKYQLDAHAERNAIINAARAGVSTVGGTLYLTCGVPCKECAIEIVQAGIKKVYAAKTELGLEYDDTKETNYYLSRWLFKKGGVELIEYEPELLDEVIKEMAEKEHLPMGV